MRYFYSVKPLLHREAYFWVISYVVKIILTGKSLYESSISADEDILTSDLVHDFAVRNVFLFLVSPGDGP